jgi:N-acyl-D-amino-acid deacylase
MYDLVIRGGTVVDGYGGEPRKADVAIDGSRIVHVGADASRGSEEIDASGKIVTPGFIDLHTHYDAQVIWDPLVTPSSLHGVTTIVTGNCGVGFAPVRPEARSWLMEVMEGVEEIPRSVLNAGLSWEWETFSEYLDALDTRPHAVDIGAQVPHIAVRAYVMGERASRDEVATSDDIDAMARVVEEALRSGALGFACTRTDAHRLPDGSLVPGSFANPDELLGIASGIRRAGGGPVQFLGNPSDWDENLPFMIEMALRANTSVQFTMSDTDWPSRLAGIEQATAAGAKLVGHVPPRAVGNVLQWRADRHPFMHRPSVQALSGLSWPERLARFKDPAFRSQVLSEGNGDAEMLMPEFARTIYRSFDRMYEVDEIPDYEPDPRRDSVAARAAADDQDPAAYAYDAMTANDGEGMLYLTLANYRSGDLSVARELIVHPGTVVSLSDAGAHCTRVIDASLPTFMMTHWARDRQRGPKLPLSTVVRSCTLEPAVAYGLLDRGVVQQGYVADLNVIDFDNLRLPAPYLSFDLPQGGRRLLQRAEGYVATIKSGQITFRNGNHTGVLPGGVIRGPQPAPKA